LKEEVAGSDTVQESDMTIERDQWFGNMVSRSSYLMVFQVRGLNGVARSAALDIRGTF
jgi:hypothetical protein